MLKVECFDLSRSEIRNRATRKSLGGFIKKFMKGLLGIWILVLGSNAIGQLVINEVEANPDGRSPSIGLRETQLLHLDPPTYSDWLEIKNVSGNTVSLDGYTLTDDPSIPGMWTYPSGMSIAPGAFLIVLADGLDGDGDNVHTSFGLSSKGDYVRLYNAAAAVIDEWVPEFPRQFPSHSFGRESGGATLGCLATATPGAENPGTVVVGYVRKPTFDVPPGFHEAPVSVTLSSETAGAAIHYTLNGDQPITSITIYTGPIASTVGEVLGIRARAFMGDLVPSVTTSATYLMNQPTALKTLPVISWLGGEEEVFYDPGGIIDNTRDQDREREREASMEFFQNDKLYPTQHWVEIGFRGGGSREISVRGELGLPLEAPRV